MDFYDPEGSPVVRPEGMVRALTLGGLREEALRVGEVAVIVVTGADLRGMARKLRAKPQYAWRPYRKLYTSQGITVALSPFGAPNVVALAEELRAFGGEVFLFFGYCGSLREEVRAGEIVLPTKAIREEGTSFHYLPEGEEATASDGLSEAIERVLREEGVSFRKGLVWTTDAIYRETSRKVERYAEMGCLGVEMETAALFTWGRASGVEVGGLLVVTDELSGGHWTPRFRSTAFLRGRRRGLDLMANVAKALRQRGVRSGKGP